MVDFVHMGSKEQFFGVDQSILFCFGHDMKKRKKRILTFLSS